jgi:cytochrome o ubiquinol oxidase subunit 1
VPNVDHLDQFWEDKESGKAYKQPAHYEDIHMPRNTGVGVFMGIFGTIMGFALVWHIWWMAIVGFLGMVVSLLVRAYDRDIDYYVPAKEVEAIETARYRQLQQAA